MLRNFSLGVAGAVALLLLVEILLRVLPVSTATLGGYYLDPMIMNYPPQHEWRTAKGWDLRNARSLKANNLGFVADTDFVPNADAIGLIGDSYVEAGMLDEAERPAAQLRAALEPRRQVYAFGGPGSSLLDYAERIRYASQQLGVRDFVVFMEAGDLRQALCGSGNVHAACLDGVTQQARVEAVPGPTLAKRLLRHSALAQYLAGQLMLDGARLPGQLFPGLNQNQGQAGVMPLPGGLSEPGQPEAQAELQRTAMAKVVGETFFTRIKPYATGRLVFIVDGRRLSTTPRTGLTHEREVFMALARQRGASVLDAEQIYFKHSDQSSLSLGVSPSDAHLNGLGVDLLMQATAKLLQ